MKELKELEQIWKLKENDIFMAKSGLKVEIWVVLKDDKVKIIYPPRQQSINIFRLNSSWNYDDYNFYKVTYQEMKNILFVENL